MEKKNHIFANILIVLPLLFAAYLIIAEILWSIAGAVLYAELGICALAAVAAVCLRTGALRKLPDWLAWIIRIILCAIFGFILALILVICCGLHEKAAQPADYAVTLGYRLGPGGKPDETLGMRVDTAYEYITSHPDTVLIVSGGNGIGDIPSEAAVMKEMLAAKGLDSEWILSEDRSSNTVENLRNISGFTGTDINIVIITSDYHICRAKAIANKTGFASVQGEAAPSPAPQLPASILKECVCMIIELFRGTII